MGLRSKLKIKFKKTPARHDSLSLSLSPSLFSPPRIRSSGPRISRRGVWPARPCLAGPASFPALPEPACRGRPLRPTDNYSGCLHFFPERTSERARRRGGECPRGLRVSWSLEPDHALAPAPAPGGAVAVAVRPWWTLGASEPDLVRNSEGRYFSKSVVSLSSMPERSREAPNFKFVADIVYYF